jgi:upstream activation factor subunit UAF30
MSRIALNKCVEIANSACGPFASAAILGTRAMSPYGSRDSIGERAMPSAPKKTATKAKAPAPKKKAAPAASAFNKPLTPSKELAAVVGAEPLPRTEVVSKVWVYIKKHKLQNPANKREILADDKLQAVFGKKAATMFELNKFLAKHLK